MSQATDFLEAALLDHLFGISAYTAPATMYLGLATAMSSGETPTFTECTGGSYARVAITNDATSWSRTSNVLTNDNLLTFATATGSQGTATHWFLSDAASGGNMLIYGELPEATAIVNGTTFRVAAGQLDITLSAKSTYAAGKLLDHVFGIASWTVPANQYIAAFTANPTDAGGGTEVSTSGTAYDRQTVANSASGWSRTANAVSNDAAVEWDEATASYGSVTGHASFDDPTTGNMLWWTARSAPVTIGIGSQLGIGAGDLTYTFD